MSGNKQIAAVLVTLVLGLAAMTGNAAAQCSPGGGSGSNHVSVVVANDNLTSSPVGSSYSFDLFTRFRMSTITMFSWGRGPVGLPGTVRSSYAVLRERLGLKR